jgi:hypothetical protein
MRQVTVILRGVAIVSDDAWSWDKAKWAPLTEMAEGFNEFRPPLTGKLAGQRVDLRCHNVGAPDDAFTFRHDFRDGGHLSWSTRDDDRVVGGGAAEYEAFEMDEDLFYVHYLRQGTPQPEAVSFALDLRAGACTGAIGRLGLEPEPSRARQTWFQGLIEESGTSDIPHLRTTELVDRRVRYRYSSDDVYDHIYLSENLFTWVCMSGAEKGQADTDQCTCWKIREDIYLFSWLEKLLGVEGMVLVNFRQLRSVGIQFALDQYSGELVNLTMGAYAMPLHVTPPVVAHPGRPSPCGTR